MRISNTDDRAVVQATISVYAMLCGVSKIGAWGFWVEEFWTAFRQAGETRHCSSGQNANVQHGGAVQESMQ